MHASRRPFFTCLRRCACRRLQIPTAARGLSTCISGSVLHLSPQVCTCRRLQKRTTARRYKIMHLRAPVPGDVHWRKAAKTNRSTQVLVHACRGPFLTCPRRCALAEGCKNEPQHAGISACISGSVSHLSPEVCTCRRLQKRTTARRYKIMHLRAPEEMCTGGRLQKRTAARRYKCMHVGVRSSPVPGDVHLQKAAKTNRSTQA